MHLEPIDGSLRPDGNRVAGVVEPDVVRPDFEDCIREVVRIREVAGGAAPERRLHDAVRADVVHPEERRIVAAVDGRLRPRTDTGPCDFVARVPRVAGA